MDNSKNFVNCPNKDKEYVGECYSRCLHQVPGIEVFPTHKVFLRDSNVKAQGRRIRTGLYLLGKHFRW